MDASEGGDEDEDTKRRAGINFAARPSVERWFRRRRGSAVLTASIVPKLGERRLHDLLSSRRGSADIPAPSLHKLSGRRFDGLDRPFEPAPRRDDDSLGEGAAMNRDEVLMPKVTGRFF